MKTCKGGSYLIADRGYSSTVGKGLNGIVAAKIVAAFLGELSISVLGVCSGDAMGAEGVGVPLLVLLNAPVKPGRAGDDLAKGSKLWIGGAVTY